MTVRLFLCDDNVEYRRLARLVLEKQGYEIVGEAANGQEAIERAAEADPDVVVLDLNMPVMNGYEALPRLRTIVPSARIVVLTTGQAQDERRRALDAGADGFIVKPDRIYALHGELQDALAA